MHSAPIRRTVLVVAGVVTLVVAAACEPIRNAPPGGGEVVEATYTIGPFDLAPEGQSGDQDVGSRANVPRPSGAFGIKSMAFDLVDADGTPIPRHDAHLHHVLLMNSARRDQFCNRTERFSGAGAERTTLSLPDPYAYLVGANESWNALWHVMNMSDQAMEVYIQYKVSYQPNANATNSRGVTPFFLDVTGCGNSEYDVPGNGGPGSVHTATRTWSAPWDGYLVAAGGHLHGGGINVAIRDDAADRECKMEARYDHGDHHTPMAITTCPIHYRVHAGQRYSVLSRYDNSEPLDAVMGIVLAYAWQGTQ